jgi:hypothetical protein
LRDVDGEIHEGKIKYRRLDLIENEHRLLIEIGMNYNKKQMLTLISQNGHVQLTPKTTPARCLKKEEDFSPKENLLFLFRLYQRAKLAENPCQLAYFLKSVSLEIAGNFLHHRLYKYINYKYAIRRAREAAPQPNLCAVL